MPDSRHCVLQESFLKYYEQVIPLPAAASPKRHLDAVLPLALVGHLDVGRQRAQGLAQGGEHGDVAAVAVVPSHLPHRLLRLRHPREGRGGLRLVGVVGGDGGARDFGEAAGAAVEEVGHAGAGVHRAAGEGGNRVNVHLHLVRLHGGPHRRLLAEHPLLDRQRANRRRADRRCGAQALGFKQHPHVNDPCSILQHAHVVVRVGPRQLRRASPLRAIRPLRRVHDILDLEIALLVVIVEVPPSFMMAP
mmetsp:Transcript_24530/g.61890  ORF Transcript_24530/g.61890 Transcript_24530/m.61890 type:complete len:248 (-) Transcript_24530:213-956(-)